MIKAGYFLNQAGGRIVQFVVQVPVLEFSFRGTGMQIDDINPFQTTDPKFTLLIDNGTDTAMNIFSSLIR